MNQPQHHEILIVGGGTAGITVAAQLLRKQPQLDIAIIDPADKHYYQPLWTLAGAGLVRKEVTERPLASVIPKRATWIRDAVAEFQPALNQVRTRDGKTITYTNLVVAAGLTVRWNAIPGLQESVGHDGVCSNYSFDTVDSTWEAIRNFQGGTALFTHPSGAVKCGGAPQKIMYLADDRFREAQVREKTKIIFASAQPDIFAVQPYRATLEKVVARKQIECRFKHELIRIQPETRTAHLRNLDTQEEVAINYALLHVTPPMGPPDFIASTPLADPTGWVNVDPETLRHVDFSNIFSLGDCSNLPTSKTGAAIRKQAPVVVKNLLATIQHKPLTAQYDGYTSCPLVTGIGRLVLAEFNYRKEPDESFPVDQSRERWSMWILKRYLLPFMYWHGMLKGRM